MQGTFSFSFEVKDMRQKYSYSGPVMEFDRLLVNNWMASTIAESESKARSNLAYQFKKKHNRSANSRIFLPGKIITEEMNIRSGY